MAEMLHDEVVDLTLGEPALFISKAPSDDLLSH